MVITSLVVSALLVVDVDEIMIQKASLDPYFQAKEVYLGQVPVKEIVYCGGPSGVAYATFLDQSTNLKVGAVVGSTISLTAGASSVSAVSATLAGASVVVGCVVSRSNWQCRPSHGRFNSRLSSRW
jgi:hypothetical protein